MLERPAVAMAADESVEAGLLHLLVEVQGALGDAAVGGRVVLVARLRGETAAGVAGGRGRDLGDRVDETARDGLVDAGATAEQLELALGRVVLLLLDREL